jgi:hypothetical protein
VHSYWLLMEANYMRRTLMYIYVYIYIHPLLSDEQVDGKHYDEDDQVEPIWSDQAMCQLSVGIGRFC